MSALPVWMSLREFEFEGKVFEAGQKAERQVTIAFGEIYAA